MVVVLDEAGSLVARKACFPRLAIVFDLFCGSKLFVWHIEACDFPVRVDSVLLAIRQPSIVLRVLCSSSLLGVLCSSFRIVAKFVWYLDAAKAVGAAKHRHHALNGASQRQLLVRMTHWPCCCRATFLFPLQMAVELFRSDRNETSTGCVIVGLLHLPIEPTALLLSAVERFRSQCDSKLSARVHCRIILQSTSRLQHRLPRLLAPSAEFVFAVLCSSGLRKQLLQTRSSRSRHGNDFFVTMREATPLSLQWLQCRPRELSYANLDAACEVVFSNWLLISGAISPHAYKGVHATQLGVHEVVQQKEQLHL